MCSKSMILLKHGNTFTLNVPVFYYILLTFYQLFYWGPVQSNFMLLVFSQVKWKREVFLMKDVICNVLHILVFIGNFGEII
jgi:hypothetical protein